MVDGSSGYVLAYQDKEGDWLLVGDVPWGCVIFCSMHLPVLLNSNLHPIIVLETDVLFSILRRLFLNTVKRLRIMRASAANGFDI